MNKQKNYIDEVLEEFDRKQRLFLAGKYHSTQFNEWFEQKFQEAEQQERKNLKSRLEVILTDPDNYLRGQLEDLIKELK